uniref:NADH dehydrogenase subunit 2 n=1 Tax=Plagiorchis multiglandularis TaxID=3026102 RepID=UPI0023D84561|nr:NADH dehydrogenase subunit 2 [Plagiorchis multiglandularis]WCQ78409.1 NADH dehydrogenase subunit 2 [Plagiorchis multiglandularis]
MRGYFVFSFSLAGLAFFSGLLFSAGNLFVFWLFLELCVLFLVPMFFLKSELLNLCGLFNYLIVSSVSSSFLIAGILFESFLWFIVLGLLIKFGIFPFIGWVYSVINNSNWYVVWGLSTFLKVPFFVVPFFLSGVSIWSVYLLCSISFIFLSIIFWVYTVSWRTCWSHMMLSSSASLIAMSFVQSLESLLPFFLVYFFWSSACIIFISYQEDFILSGTSSFFFYVVLLVSLPFSFSIFYKLLSTAYMFSCYFYVFFSWVVYTISEQVYLLKFLIDTNVPRSLFSVSFLV